MAKSDVAKERFFNLPVIVLISLSFMLGMSEFIVVGVLPDIAAGLKVSEVTVAIWCRCSRSCTRRSRRSDRRCRLVFRVLPRI